MRITGLLYALLAPGGLAIAGDMSVTERPLAWRGLADQNNPGASRSRSTGRHDDKAFEFRLRGLDASLNTSGLFIHPARGVRIGARGAIDLGTGRLTAVLALKLDF